MHTAYRFLASVLRQVHARLASLGSASSVPGTSARTRTRPLVGLGGSCLHADASRSVCGHRLLAGSRQSWQALLAGSPGRPSWLAQKSTHVGWRRLIYHAMLNFDWLLLYGRVTRLVWKTVRSTPVAYHVMLNFSRVTRVFSSVAPYGACASSRDALIKQRVGTLRVSG